MKRIATSYLSLTVSVSVRAEYKAKMRAKKGLAGSILYIACKETGEHKPQKVMASAASVTEVTIRKS